MHFTVVFNSHEASDLSFGLVFVPTAVWIRGGVEVYNPGHASYQRGDVEAVLNLSETKTSISQDPRAAVVVVHDAGHACDDDLDALCDDLDHAGFYVDTAYLDEGRVRDELLDANHDDSPVAEAWRQLQKRRLRTLSSESAGGASRAKADAT